ncbi:MAG: sodium-dependent transporter [Bdellovibrionales bacterium]|nr:sodium-dependent transporter [Bdellovibrionales bacterium]
MGAGRGTWGTRLGFYLAAIGSAFGLGNIWRFPYIVSENGGGAFVLLYVFLVFILGMPLLVGELILGRTTRSGVMRAIDIVLEDHKNSPNQSRVSKMKWLGIGSVVLCLIVLAYYAVISGWVLHYLTQLSMALIVNVSFEADQSLKLLLENGWLQVLLTSVHLLVVIVIVAKDVEEGIEKAVGYMMPLFVILLIGLAIKSLSLESAPNALRFFLYPDFSSLTLESLGQAVGHVFFTLSIGFGMMVTFGSYLSDRAYIPIAGFRVATMDSFISIFAGVLIFPLVMVGTAPVSGPEMLFRSVPKLFQTISNGYLFGVGFFVCLYLAALGASIGLLETIVSNARESLGFRRVRAVWVSGGACFILALLPALSTSVFQEIHIGGQGFLEFLDGLLINWGLPVAALITSQVVLYLVSDAQKKQAFELNSEEHHSSEKIYGHWIFALRWLVSPVILLALVLQVFAIFKR